MSMEPLHESFHCDVSPETRLSDAKNADHFAIDDLLDFPSDDNAGAVDGGGGGLEGADSSPLTAATDNSCSSVVLNSSPETAFVPGGAGHFAGELCDPYDVAELEWLSHIVDESFSSEEDLQKLQLLQGIKARPDSTNLHQFQSNDTETRSPRRAEMSVPAKARSKRSRAAPVNWSSRLLVRTPSPPAVAVTSASEAKMAVKAAAHKKKDGNDGSTGGEGRKCLHCATEKTPQWRTGPLGPKTLCNACGVRYKSGRLVPEYRPAASPTYVQTKHSNSHRKVMELRRQKEMQQARPQPPPAAAATATAAAPYMQHHHHHQNVMFDDDYLIHQHIGPDFRQMI